MGMRQKRGNNFILTACVLMLVIICFLSVYRPMVFDRERGERELTVKTRLMKIRQAQERFRKATWTYT